MFKLNHQEANAPKPQPPDNICPRQWRNYFIDLACWKATQAEKLLSGIEDNAK